MSSNQVSALDKLRFDAKFAARRVLVKFPRFYLRVTQARSQPDSSYLSGVEAVFPNSDILITGLPRTGNSFSVNAFRLAQRGPVRIAHHEYPPPQVVGAVRYRIPILVIIRNPDDVALSRVVSHPPLTLRQALIDFAQAYGSLASWTDHFVLATFREITSDFGLVTRRVNERFATEFDEFEHTEANVSKAFELIDGRYQAMGPEEQRSFGRVVARPSSEREAAKTLLVQELKARQLAGLREKAWSAYGELTGHHEPPTRGEVP